MALLRHAGYRTITLAAFVAHLHGEPVALPARPFLLTFDDGRLDSYTGSDATLLEFGGRHQHHETAHTWRTADKRTRGAITHANKGDGQ